MASDADPVVILGGGLTGISTALHLGARTPWVLFEREERLGGHARTDTRDGFCFDKTGHWLHLRDRYTKQLVHELLPDALVPVERRARVFSHGALTRYPFQANLHGLPPSVIKECLLGFLERPQNLEARDFEEYCLKHFGVGISKHFMIPYNRKLWGVEPREITSAWCDRFVPRPTLEQVVAGAVGASPPEMGYNISFLYPKQGGIETLTRALVARLDGGRVHTRAAPDRIDPEARTITVGGETLAWRALVTSIPLPELFRVMSPLPPEVERAAGLLRCTPVQYLNVATKRTPPVDFHWIYVPEEKYPFYRVGVYTNAVPAMAPPGRGGLYVELAARNVARVEDVLADVAAGLCATGVLAGPDDILFAELRTIRWAYVVFDHNYYDATATCFRYLSEKQIYPRGRYGSWTYNAMEDCILAGRAVADEVVAAK
ncbi:MAG TPA: FAD-dependent oxidoreductase [Polyangia bacterium]|nr:FAD-dependent oxidoreductase [Polyangia bacterium]